MAITGKPKPFYRPILRSALHHVLVERDVWLFGILAVVWGSGSAIETVLRAENGLEQFGAPFLTKLFPFIEAPRQWADQLAVLSPLRAIVTVALVVAGAALLLWLSALSQGVMVAGSKPKRSEKTMHHLVVRARPLVWKILAVDVLLKVGLTLAVIMLLAPLLTTTPVIAETLLFLQVAVSYGILFSVTTIAIYALNEIVHRNAPVRESIASAWQTFTRHPMASLETALLLFFLNLFVGLAALAALALLSLPYTLFFLLSAAAGSVLATSLTTAITFFIAFAVLLILGGFTTAFNYTVLSLTYEQLRTGRFVSKWSRILKTGHWF